MAVWCERCDGKGYVEGFFYPVAQEFQGQQVVLLLGVPRRPCVYCLGQGVYKASNPPKDKECSGKCHED